jgi:hypothetical protein
MAAHVEGCLKAKNEKAKRKKEQKEAREREKKLQSKENEKDEEGDTRMDDDDEDEDVAADKKGPGGLKSTKKSAGKKIEIEDTKKGKKRKADGDAEKGPKQKKKKEEPKPKAPKQKGIVDISRYSCFLSSLYRCLIPLDRVLLSHCCLSRYRSFPLSLTPPCGQHKHLETPQGSCQNVRGWVLLSRPPIPPAGLPWLRKFAIQTQTYSTVKLLLHRSWCLAQLPTWTTPVCLQLCRTSKKTSVLLRHFSLSRL